MAVCSVSEAELTAAKAIAAGYGLVIVIVCLTALWYEPAKHALLHVKAAVLWSIPPLVSTATDGPGERRAQGIVGSLRCLPPAPAAG